LGVEQNGHSSEQRNTISAATSSADPTRSSGVGASFAPLNAGGAVAVIGVSM
jgi:hypothetical protein